LSHYYPEPEYVEVARAAAVLCTASLFMGYGPQVVRQLVTLRRLPAAPPDTLLRAISAVLSAVPEMLPPDYAVLRELCASEQPLLAGIAECVATYVWEYEHDIDRSLASARRGIEALAPVDHPFLQVLGHARLSELCLQAEQGEAAYEHLRAALAALPRLGDEHDSIGVRWGLVLACLQRGEPDEAEYWLRQAEDHNPAQKDDVYSPDFGGRAEIALARGLTEVGLGLWRRNVEAIPEAGSTQNDDPFYDRWLLQVQSAAVTAHAHAGRLELVADVVDRLRQRMRTLLSGPARSPMELPVFGTGLHALGMAGLVSGDASAVRLIALAERLRVLRDFQPTMSADRARRAVGAAGNAAGAAYADAVSEYAALERDELREAARAAMTATSVRG
jgi:tetratricopeptide (TPR) repeat protein